MTLRTTKPKNMDPVLEFLWRIGKWRTEEEIMAVMEYQGHTERYALQMIKENKEAGRIQVKIPDENNRRGKPYEVYKFKK